MDTRAIYQTACKKYKGEGRTTIDCRSATPLLFAELTRLGHFKPIPKVVPKKSLPVVVEKKKKETPPRQQAVILYEIYKKLPVEVLIRLHDREILSDKLFWRLRLETILPKALIPSWIDNVDTLRGYTLQRNNEVIGTLVMIGGKHNTEFKLSHRTPDYHHEIADVRLISESGPFYFVRTDNSVNRLVATADTYRKINIPESGRITKIVGVNKFSVFLLGNGKAFMKGKYHQLSPDPTRTTLLPSFGEPILDVNISDTHLVFQTPNSYFVVGSNEKEDMPDGSIANHLPFATYHKLSMPVPFDVPKNTFKVVPGNSCTYALTNSGEVWVVGLRKSYIGVDLQGKNFTHTWMKVPIVDKGFEDVPLVVTKLVTSKEHTLVLLVDGRVFGWGRFTAKEFGFLKINPIFSPELLFDNEKIVDINTSRWRTTLISVSEKMYITGGYEAEPTAAGSIRITTYDRPEIISPVNIKKIVDIEKDKKIRRKTEIVRAQPKLASNFSVGTIYLV